MISSNPDFLPKASSPDPIMLVRALRHELERGHNSAQGRKRALFCFVFNLVVILEVAVFR